MLLFLLLLGVPGKAGNNNMLTHVQIASAKPGEKATLIAPDNAEAHANLGRHLAVNGDHERAIPIIKRALEIQPSAEIHDMLGKSFGQLERWADAEAAFRCAIAVTSDDGSLPRSLGICIMKQGRLDEAIEVFLQRMRLVPDDQEIEQLIAELRGMAIADDVGPAPGMKGTVP